MKVIIDTNRYCDFCEGISEVVEVFQKADLICVPFTVLAELRAGFSYGTIESENERILSLFLNKPRVRCLLADEQTTFHYARLYAQLRKAGTPIPTNDLWIAALTLQHNLVLYSRDKHFESLPQLAKIS